MESRWIRFGVVASGGCRCGRESLSAGERFDSFTVEGPAEWRGGIAQGPDNYILSEKLPVECGVNRALLRSSVTAGKVVVRAEAEGLASASLELVSSPVEVQNGLSTYIPGDDLEGSLDRGETPLSPSYIDRAVDVAVLSAEAGINTEEACKSFDDNELSEWKMMEKLPLHGLNITLKG